MRGEIKGGLDWNQSKSSVPVNNNNNIRLCDVINQWSRFYYMKEYWVVKYKYKYKSIMTSTVLQWGWGLCRRQWDIKWRERSVADRARSTISFWWRRSLALCRHKCALTNGRPFLIAFRFKSLCVEVSQPYLFISGYFNTTAQSLCRQFFPECFPKFGDTFFSP